MNMTEQFKELMTICESIPPYPVDRTKHWERLAQYFVDALQKAHEGGRMSVVAPGAIVNVTKAQAFIWTPVGWLVNGVSFYPKAQCTDRLLSDWKQQRVSHVQIYVKRRTNQTAEDAIAGKPYP